MCSDHHHFLRVRLPSNFSDKIYAVNIMVGNLRRKINSKFWSLVFLGKMS